MQVLDPKRISQSIGLCGFRVNRFRLWLTGKISRCHEKCFHTHREEKEGNVHEISVDFDKTNVEQYYNTVIIIDYQLQILLHFGNTVKTEPCEYHFNFLMQSRHGTVLLYND